MKKIFTLLVALAATVNMMAAGWPASYGGVMLQGFYWDSYSATAWKTLEKQADDFSGYFDLVWVPQSGKTNEATSMGYDPYYYFNQNSSFGTEPELRSMISTFKNKGIGTIADVVINHRNTNGWFSFPAETYKGVTYQMLPSDIVSDDDGGEAASEAKSEKISLSSNKDEGEGFQGYRDLDHKSTNVQKIVEAYEDFLLNDLGYAGFRYDMVKGFNGSHIADYNDAAGVKFSVGECFDGDSKIRGFIDATNKKSAAFDFQFRYTVRNAINNNDWTYLTKQNDGNWPLISNSNNSGSYRQYAVTFVENHDMQDRGTTNNYTPDPIRKDTLAANAFLLAMPGTPCVFLPHYIAYKNEIKNMIDARKAAGITNTSTPAQLRGNARYYAGQTDKKLAYVIGDQTVYTPSTSTYQKILSGYHYSYYLAKSLETVFSDVPSGNYEDVVTPVLTAVSATEGAKIVYTLDGTTPTASAKAVTSGTKITIPYEQGTSVTLKAALLINGKVGSTVITRTYNYTEPEEDVFESPEAGYTFTAYFVAPSTWNTSTDVCAWAWNGSVNYTGNNWPGDKEHVYCIGKTSDGRYIFQWCYYGNETTAPASIIFNNGQSGVGTNQTKDLVFTNEGWYAMDGSTTANPTLGIGNIRESADNARNGRIYNLAGQQTDAHYKGIVIKNGKKYVVK